MKEALPRIPDLPTAEELATFFDYAWGPLSQLAKASEDETLKAMMGSALACVVAMVPLLHVIEFFPTKARGTVAADWRRAADAFVDRINAGLGLPRADA